MRSRGKKGLSILLAMLLLLSGCYGGTGRGRTENGSAALELELSVSWWGDENRNEYTQELLELYEQQHPGIRFLPTALPKDEYDRHLAVTAAAGECPDIMLMDRELLTIYTQNHSLADCEDILQKGAAQFSGGEGQSGSALLSTGEREGIQAGIPVSLSVPVLYRHTGRLREAGLEAPECMDWKGFMEICTAYREKTGEPGFSCQKENGRLLLCWMEQKGTPLYRGGRVALGPEIKPALLSYFTFFDRLIRRKAMTEPEGQEESAIAGKTAGEEKAAFYFGVIPDEEAIEDMDVMPLPGKEEGTRLKAEPELFFSFSASLAGEKRKAAADFLTWFLSDGYAVSRAGLERGIPASAKARELLEESGTLFPAERALLAICDQLEREEAGYEETPENPEEADRIYREVFGELFQGNISPEKAAEQYYRDMAKLSAEQEALNEDEGKTG